MTPDLSSYPSTYQGAEDLTKDLLPTIVRLWKTERLTLGDDLVAILDAQTNRVRLEPRSVVYGKLKTNHPDLDFLPRLLTPAPGAGATASLGSICIWTLIGFSNGQICVRSLVLARS